MGIIDHRAVISDGNSYGTRAIIGGNIYFPEQHIRMPDIFDIVAVDSAIRINNTRGELRHMNLFGVTSLCGRGDTTIIISNSNIDVIYVRGVHHLYIGNCTVRAMDLGPSTGVTFRDSAIGTVSRMTTTTTKVVNFGNQDNISTYLGPES